MPGDGESVADSPYCSGVWNMYVEYMRFTAIDVLLAFLHISIPPTRRTVALYCIRVLYGSAP